VARAAKELEQAGITPLAVVQAKPEQLRRFEVPVPVASDPDRELYHAFGLGRVPWYQWLRPDVWAGFVWHTLTLTPPKVPTAGEDVFQRGGDFLIRRDLTIVAAWSSKTPTQRVRVKQILAAVGRANPASTG
jgi:hypothetical protein